MKTSQAIRRPRGVWCLLILALLLPGWIHNALAFTAVDRDLCWSAWTNAFYYVTGDGRGHFRNREGNTSAMSFWQEAEEIEVFCDATNVSNQITLVSQVCSGFTNQFGVNWSWNTFNDDLMWSSMAFSRAYLLTGNTNWRTLAKNSFDLAYSRGWDTNNGGIYQTTGNTDPKCTCGNGPGACAAYLLYQTLNDVTYKTKAQGIYGWMVTNVFDVVTGAVMEGPGTGNYFTYDSGTFATIALWLGETNNAFKAGDWVTNHWGVAMQSFGPGSDGGGMNGICLRGLARTGHNIPFLQAACDNAWSWRNVRGLTDTDWNRRTSDADQFYSYDTCSHVAGLLCVPPGAPPTLPVTAASVVGSEIIFTTAAIGGSNLVYQWQVIKAGATNNLPGATNATLTLSNLQQTNTASYRLQASNALGIITSTPGSLTVSSAPAPVNNVVTSYAAQTGLGYGFAFTPTWIITTSGSLIAGQFPSSTNGDFSLEPNWGVRNVSSLTAGDNLTITPGGSPTVTSTNYVTCGNGSGAGSSVIYTLTGPASGCSLTNIVVYGGWRDAGRDQQAYTVSYSRVTAPATFVTLASVTYNPANPADARSATRVSLAPATGSLATNVAAVKFDFTSPASENGYCGYAEISLFGFLFAPVMTTNTLPVTATDVVGSQVTFTAGFAGSNLIYQWQKVSGGVTNPVAGATNATVTLTNLQLADAAGYYLRATNSFGVAFSAASALTVSNLPAAVNNVITAIAAQTGTGSGTFTPTWTMTTNNSLIAGQSPGSAGGNFTLEIPGRTVNALTDGGAGDLTQITATVGFTTSTNYVTCGNGGGAGSSVIYTLNGSGSGYSLTNVTVYGGWADAGRDQQAYTVHYSKVAAPATFISLGSVNFNPVNPANAQSATRISLLPAAGVLATNVAAVKFDFTTPASENGYCGYTEVALFGMATTVMADNPTNIMFQLTNDTLRLTWPGDHTGWRLQTQTNDLAAGLGTNWVDVPGAAATNELILPISPSSGSIFYRMINP